MSERVRWPGPVDPTKLEGRSSWYLVYCSLNRRTVSISWAGTFKLRMAEVCGVDASNACRTAVPGTVAYTDLADDTHTAHQPTQPHEAWQTR